MLLPKISHQNCQVAFGRCEYQRVNSTHWHHWQLKQPNGFGDIFQSKAFFVKMFEGDMIIRTIPVSVLQIFCKIIVNFEVFIKGIISSDDNF